MDSSGQMQDHPKIKELLKEIELTQNAIEKAKKLTRTLEKHLSDIPTQMGFFAEDNEEDCRKIAHYLYWHILDLPAFSITSALATNRNKKLSPKKFCEFIGPETFKFQCKNCGAPIFLQPTSRTDRDFQQQFAIYRDRPNLYCSDEYLCEKCLTVKNEREEGERREKARLQRLRAMPYEEYLKTEHWQETRKNALKSAGYRCQLCNANGTLHVHHKTYKRRGEELPKDLIVLCEGCHSKFHDKIPEQKG